MSNPKSVARIWTDGSCYPNPGGPGGWAAIILAKVEDVTEGEIADTLTTAVAFDKSGDVVYRFPEQGKKIRWKARIIKGGCKAAEANTNNRMEAKAIIEAIRVMKPCRVEIITDSQYAIGLLSGRNRAKKNKDMAMEFKTLSTGFKVHWTHVPGHNGDPLNEVADMLAGREADGYRETDSGY